MPDRSRDTTYTSKDGYRPYAIGLLLGNLLNDPCSGCEIPEKCAPRDPRFKERLSEVKRAFPAASGHAWIHVLAAIEARRQGVSLRTRGKARLPAEELANYYQALEALAQDCGLAWDWALETLHEMISRGYPYKVLRAGWWQSAPMLSIPLKVNPLMSKEQHRETLLRQFDTQWTELEQVWEQKDKLMKFRQRNFLPSHVRWTYKRYCRRATWGAIADCEARIAQDSNITQDDAIRKAVAAVAMLLKTE